MVTRAYSKKNVGLHRWETFMASAEREPITGGETEPLAGSRGRAPGQGAKPPPPEADSILAFER